MPDVEPAACLSVGEGDSDAHLGAHAAGMEPLLITHCMQVDIPSGWEGIRRFCMGVVRNLIGRTEKYFAD